jgi:energy-coupling factor transporter ATP-binding protein EcfA2
MPTGPRKIILIHSGRYDYAEVEIAGALQIVGPNNTGKTTLINTLQFLYLNDLRTMDFGYKWEQTRAFYFPSEYSYVLFECSGVQGDCVIGWRGQSQAGGGEPERFCFSGPYLADDFYDASRQVRPPRDVSARLALKNFRAIRSAEEHRELLLPPEGAGARGLGIIALRDNDKYHQFRETLKNLLALSAITQEEMRDRVLMLANIPPDRLALDARNLFGEDYDRIRDRRERLLRFKKNQSVVGRLVDQSSLREAVRGELMYRWTDLKTKQKAFEQDHTARLEAWQAVKTTQTERAQQLAAESDAKRAESARFSEQKGGVEIKLAQLAAGDREFSAFLPDLEKAAIANLQEKARVLGEQLRAAENESRTKALGKRDFFTDQVRDKEQTIARFDKVVVTALRQQFSDDELNPLFRLLNPDLLEYPVVAGSIEVHRQGELAAALRGIVARFTGDIYRDENVTIAFRGSGAPVAKVVNVEAVRERLAEDQKSLQRWQDILTAIEQRERLAAELKAIHEDLNGLTDESGQVIKEGKIRRLFRYEEHQKAKQGEKPLREELKLILESIQVSENRIKKLDGERQAAETAAREAQNSIRTQEDHFNAVVGEFSHCVLPNFSAKMREPDEALPNDFGGAVALFLSQQEKENQLNQAVHDLLGETERCFGEEFRGADEAETVRLLREELEALAEKEAALEKDWNAHIHTLRATFDQILQRLGDVQSARDDLNRHFSRVQVSDLKSVKMEVLEDAGLVSWIRRLAEYEPGGLFENDPQRESALVNFRKKLEVNSQVRYADLFTLGFTVVGADDRARTYHDFRQIESHGTTVTIKVLFNLLLLKSQLKRDDCQVPFFLDEIQILDPANRHAILDTARKLGFIAITAAPEAVSEVDALYFLQPRQGMIVLRQKHRVGVKRPAVPA